MSTKGQAILEQIRALPPAEQRELCAEILRGVPPGEYGPLTDDDLTAIADQTFVLLDKEETDAKSR